jgi:hypothetical protein
VIVAPFHGDPRFTDVKIENLSDFLFALLHFGTFVEMQALRPLSLSRSLDYLFAHPQYRDHLDVNRVGGFGGSQGGESLLLMTGAKLTITVGISPIRGSRRSSATCRISDSRSCPRSAAIRADSMASRRHFSP